MRNMIEIEVTEEVRLEANKAAIDYLAVHRMVRETLSRLRNNEIHELAMAPWVELRAGVIK